MFLGIAYAVACEWCLACIGTSDPCPGSDDVPSKPLQLLVQVRARLGRCRFPVLNSYRMAIFRLPSSRTPPLVAAPHGDAARGGHQSPHCVSQPGHSSRGMLRMPTRDVVLDLSDAENKAATRPRPLLSLKQRAFYAPYGRLSIVSCSEPPRHGSCPIGVDEECYLVDPASSHMLVSKIKPCMCKYELIQTVKLRMAH
jgi:hypothetical protein